MSERMNEQTWTDEELQTHLHEWDALYRSGGKLNLSLYYWGEEQRLGFDDDFIVLQPSQLNTVNTWFRNHPKVKP
jgi:hypothetical protein